MKRTVIIISVFSLLIISCKETKNEFPVESETTTETVDHANRATMSYKPDDHWVNDIVLNNGVQWQANKETTDGVMAMLTLIDQAGTSTTAEYKKLGDGLNEIKNTGVRECTMQGASHDNLHVWLHPLIEKIERLRKTENTEEGVNLTSNIKTQLERYFDYFI